MLFADEAQRIDFSCPNAGVSPAIIRWFIAIHMGLSLNAHLLSDISISSLGGEHLTRFDLKKPFEKWLNAAVLGYVPFPEHQQDFLAH